MSACRTVRTIVIGCSIAFAFVAPLLASAQSTPVQSFVARAVVVQVLASSTTSPAGTTPQTHEDTIEARIENGNEAGMIIVFPLYYTDGDGQQLKPEQTFYVGASLDSASTSTLSLYDYYSIDHDRLPAVIAFIALFVVCILILGGRQGLRGLVALIGGLALIFFVMLPGIAHGFSPIALAVIVASFVATLGAYITHGFNKMTSAAVCGMIISIVLSALLAELAVHVAYLSGITDEDSYNLLTDPSFGVVINFQGLLLGGIIIGSLGVLYDAAIGQAVAVEELFRAEPLASRAVVFSRALRIGREHIGALVNTLVLAYVGASLPTMLILYLSLQGDASYSPPILNYEFLATEIIRTSVGAIGLMLAIPVTTWIALSILAPKSAPEH